jgi:predicted GIY-YIG superfamily endonuclease
MERQSGIYKIKNNIDGRFYIGQAKNLPDKWATHLSLLKHGEHSEEAKLKMSNSHYKMEEIKRQLRFK